MQAHAPSRSPRGSTSGELSQHMFGPTAQGPIHLVFGKRSDWNINVKKIHYTKCQQCRDHSLSAKTQQQYRPLQWCWVCRETARMSQCCSVQIYASCCHSWNYMPAKPQHIHQYYSSFIYLRPSVLWRCWLGGRKGIQFVKNWVVGCWRGYLAGAMCRLTYRQLMPLPLTVSCFSKIQIGFTFLVQAHPGSPGERAIKRLLLLFIYISSASLWQYEPVRRTGKSDDWLTFFLLSIFYISFEIATACWLLSRPNWRIVSKLTTDIVMYCTEASNQKSKYAYRKIFFYKKSTVYLCQPICLQCFDTVGWASQRASSM